MEMDAMAGPLTLSRRAAHFRTTPALAITVLLLGLCLVKPAVAGAIEVEVMDPVPLEIWNRPVVELRARIGESSPAERAEVYQERVLQVPVSDLEKEVTVIDASMGNLSGKQIWIGRHALVSLLPQDLDPEGGESLESVAEAAAANLREVIAARLEQRRLPLLLRGLGLTALSTALFVLLLWLVWKLRARALRGLLRMTKRRDLVIFDANLRPLLIALERAVVKTLALGIGVAACYAWLTFALVQFPYSAPWGERLGYFLMEMLATFGEKMLGAIPGLFTVVVIFLFARLVTRAIAAVFFGVENGQMTLADLEPQSARLTRRLVSIVIWVFAFIIAYPYIPGSDTDAFKGISVLLGVMISLGSAGFINQIMSSMVIVYSRALGPGDYVRMGETEGVVSQVGILSTKIVTRQREEVTIPNAVMTSATVTNYTRLAQDAGVIISTGVSIGYDISWRQVHALLLQAAAQTAGISRQPAPYVLQRELADFYVQYQLAFYLAEPEKRIPVLSDLHANILDVFNDAGVQIMSPHFEHQPASKVLAPPEPDKALMDAGDAKQPA
jgi:small-conductance mechanosensitive channel